uniref:Uncharacterized protein AlNc14C76G5114 n=1 Tax=Albugo laibachii Nc14 TaxID=890382 RepID=F0WER4_9STRA|nr:conserved hypothetical protein [Albugo laibachii Nc14]|eukprot:CCA19696.1 conserved hypothetical protein [Albugo laibachii Nc14]
MCDWSEITVVARSSDKMPMRQKSGPRTFSAHEKLFHKTKTALQRELKRIKLFHARKVVQQLKNLQTEATQSATDESIQTQISKLEHKYDMLKGIHQEDLIRKALQKTQFLHVFDDLRELQKHYDREMPESTKEKQLKDKLLSHRRLQPLLESMEQIVRTERRKQEKRDIRSMRSRQKKEVLVGGRSNSAPESLFLTSLSGRTQFQDDNGDGGIVLDDELAEILGESRKKKNRPGQIARRQQAIRREHEMLTGQRRRQSTAKYGPSRRTPASIPPKHTTPKPAQKAASTSSRYPSVPNETVAKTTQRAAHITTPVEVEHPSWKAKRMLKDKERLLIATPKGKKIRFCDDE